MAMKQHRSHDNDIIVYVVCPNFILPTFILYILFFNSCEVNSNLNVLPTQTVGAFGCTMCVLLRKMAAIQLSLNTALYILLELVMMCL